jgi:hypothetical protein
MIEEEQNAMHMSTRLYYVGCQRKFIGMRAASLAGMLLSLPFAILPLTAQNTPQAATQESSSANPQATPSHQGAPAERPGSDLLAYWYGPDYRTPFVTKPGTGQAANIPRNALEYTHVGFWSMGSNFGNLTLSKSNMAEPASGGGSGATEAYFIWRSNIGLNEVTHSATFRKGPLRDVAIELGTNLETKNSSYSPAEKTIYFGPNLQFALPRGYFNVGLHLRKEWNHEAVLGKVDDYDPDFNIEPTWMLPFAIGKVHMSYSGFAEYNTQKGKDSFGSNTVGEFLVRNYVSIDVGAFLMHKPQLIDLSGGFWYWNNEYGKPASDPGAKQMSPFFGVVLHLDKNRAHRGK